MFENLDFSKLLSPAFASQAAELMDPSALLNMLSNPLTMPDPSAPAPGTEFSQFFNLDPVPMDNKGKPTAAAPKLALTPQDIAALNSTQQQKAAEPRQAPAVAPPSSAGKAQFSSFMLPETANASIGRTPNALSLGRLLLGR